LPIPEFEESGWLPAGHHVATWEETFERFGGYEYTKRRQVSELLEWFRNELKRHGVTGMLVLDGSYISTEPAPRDFDVILIAPPDIYAMKEINPELARILDHSEGEKIGYTLFYSPKSGSNVEQIISAWDHEKNSGIPKGVLDLEI
jgi:hypothetical protein